MVKRLMSSTEGARPVRSKWRRRRSSRGEAGVAAARPCLWSSARIKASMGWEVLGEVAGRAGLRRGWKAQCGVGGGVFLGVLGLSVAASGHGAPWAIQVRSVEICSFERGGMSLFRGGMKSSFSVPSTRWRIRDLSGLPGMRAGSPLSPPARAAARESMRYSLFCFSGPWQGTQCFWRTGRTDCAKSSGAAGRPMGRRRARRVKKRRIPFSMGRAWACGISRG